MKKIIRTARISDHPVVLPIEADPGMVDLPEVIEEGTPGEDAPSEAGFKSLEEQVEMVDGATAETPGVIMDDRAVVEPGFSQAEVDAMIAERLKQAEARFEKEKKAAHNAGLEAGRTQGFSEGYAKGQTEGQVQSEDEIARFQALLSALSERWGDIFKTADLNLTQIALAVARNIIGATADAHSNLVVEAVRDSLKLLQDKSRITLRIHPDDLEIMRTHRSQWMETYERIDTLILEADPKVARGGCIVETPSGDIDAQIDSRLDKLRSVLVESIQNAQPEPAPEIDAASADADDEPQTMDHGRRTTDDGPRTAEDKNE